MKINNNNLIQKTKEHVKKNKKQYIIGGVSFAVGSTLTYLLARPSIGTLNVYHTYVDGQTDPNKVVKSLFGEKTDK